MKYNFDELVDRHNIGNMKEAVTNPEILTRGIPNFSAAEMDFKTAPSIIASVKNIADRGIFGFTLPDERYCNAVGWWMKTMRKWEIEPEWIVPTLGTIYSIATAIRMTTRPGEAIIVQSPVYYRYEQAATRLKRKTVHNPLKIINGNYYMDFEDLEDKMKDENTRLFVLCNAHNPIGRVWNEDELKKIVELSNKYNVVVVSDEIFGEMTYGDRRVVPYASIREGQQNAITITSLGKAFNFTGVNHANVLIPNQELRERYIEQKYSDHYGSVGPFEYASIIGAYNEDGRAWFEEAKAYMEENVKLLHRFIREEIPEAHVFPTEGTSVCWVDWSALGLKGAELEQFFLNEALLQIESGEIYGPESAAMTRINISCPRRYLLEALNRAEKAIHK